MFSSFSTFSRMGMQPGFSRAVFQSRVPLLISGRRRRRRLCGAPPKAQKPAISQEMRDLLVSACRCGQKGVKIGATQQRRFPKTPFFFSFFFFVSARGSDMLSCPEDSSYILLLVFKVGAQTSLQNHLFFLFSPNPLCLINSFYHRH